VSGEGEPARGEARELEDDRAPEPAREPEPEPAPEPETARELEPAPVHSHAYPWIQLLLRTAVNLFFRRVEVGGRRNIPAEGGGLVISWHPNGLVDPGLILTQCPRPVVFGARHGLFRYPLLGSLLREVGTVPIYRAGDVGGDGSVDSRRAANRKSLEVLAERIAAGSLSALFPEGISHDEPGLQALRSGAARLYYRARQLAPHAPPPAILLVGLHYDDKQMFRSNALVTFHPPLSLPPELDVTPTEDVDSPAVHELSRRLTAHIEATLREVVFATDSWELHDLMHRTRRLVRAERAHRAGADPGRTTIGERALGFARVRAGYNALMQRDPAKVTALRERVARYDAELRAMKLEDYDLDRPPSLRSKWIAVLLGLQILGVFLLLPPLVVLGYLVNLPTALGLVAIAKLAARKLKDEATVKLLLGMIAFPLTWTAAGVLAGLGHHQLHLGFPRIPDAPWLAGITVAVLGALGGAAALRYLSVARETARAVRVRLTRQGATRAVARLRRERDKLYDEIVQLLEGVALPGQVAADGRVRPSDEPG
jgi:glycerol-3-phosphate O-acyltransferase/dihydroxyacetone phosphate acyltransferase